MAEHGFAPLGFLVNKQLGLPSDEQGQPHQLRIRALPGEDPDKRLKAGATLCSFLTGQDSYIMRFNSLTFSQQVIAVLIEEYSMEHPHRVTEHYLTNLTRTVYAHHHWIRP